MFPVRALSLYNGWDILCEQKLDVWITIKQTLIEMRPFLLGQRKTGRQMATLGDDKLKIRELPGLWRNLFESNSYSSYADNFKFHGYEEYRELGPNLKDGVIVRLVSQNEDPNTNLSKLIFVEAPRLAKRKIADLFVLLIPENGVLNLFGKEEVINQFPFTESACRRQIAGLLPIPFGSPFVIIFFSQFERSAGIEIHELHTQELPPRVNQITSGDVIERSLEFAPEHAQAGIGILSYFSEVLRQKYPDLNVKVRIEQQGTTVLMHVELPSGGVDTIKEELATYFLVVAGKEKPETLLSNPYHVMALENRLQIANMELRMSHRLNEQLNNDVTQLRESQTRMEESFKQQIAEQGQQIRSLIGLAERQVGSYERVQLAHISHSASVFERLTSQATGNPALLDAINRLEHNLAAGAGASRTEIIDAIQTIKQENPSLIWQMVELVKNTGYGVIGNIAYDLLKQGL